MTGSAKLAVYIFLQLSDTPRGLNEGEGNECIRLSWMDFRELQFINARRDKYARIQRFGLPRTGVRGSGANLNLSFVFEEYRPLALLVRLPVCCFLHSNGRFFHQRGGTGKRLEVGRIWTNVQFCCVKARLMPQLKQNVGSLQNTESCPAVKSLIKSWFWYESSLWLCSWRAHGQRGVGAEARCFQCDE